MSKPTAPSSLLLVSLLALLPATAAAQSVEADLRTIGALNAQRYAEPLTRGMALAMAAGSFDGAAAIGALGFDVGVRVAAAFPPDEAQWYEVALPESVTWEDGGSGGTFDDPYRAKGGELRTPTLAGEGPGVVLEPSGSFRTALVQAGRDPADFELTLPGGRDIPLVPHPVFHLSVGIGIGTELTLRYLPRLEADEEVGAFQGFGFGARHDLTRWFSAPVDLSVIATRQSLEVGDYAEATSTQLGLAAGRTVGPLSVFATGTVREGEVDVRYRTENPGNQNPALPPDGTEIRFSEDVDRGAVLGVGARLQLLGLNLAGHYTFDDYPLLTLKLGFGTR